MNQEYDLVEVTQEVYNDPPEDWCDNCAVLRVNDDGTKWLDVDFLNVSINTLVQLIELVKA
jgi:hypothetical protein